MTIEVTIELVSENHYSEVKRELHLPFVPFVGLHVQLDLVEASSSDIATLHQDHLIPGIIRLDRIVFSIEQDKFLAKSFQQHASKEHVKSAISQFTYFFGFTKVCEYDYE